MAQFIESRDNPIIKLAVSLNQKKARKEHNLALIEGAKIIDEAIKAGVSFYKLLIDESKKNEYKTYLNKLSCEAIFISSRLFEGISPTQSPQGILAIIDTPKLQPMVIAGDFLVLDNVQDPGNVGATIRSAAASGFMNIFLLNCVDIYNDKVVRASMGNLFKTNNYSVSFEKLQQLVAAKENMQILLSDMSGENIFKIDLPKDKTIGIIIGNEGSGVGAEVAALASKTVSIPMQNEVESLNAAVSASILMYQLRNTR